MLTPMRLRVLAPFVAGALALGLASVATADPGRPTPYHRGLMRGHASQARDPITVGGLTLRPCGIVARAYCGHIRRDWEPAHPAAGTVRVGFAFVPARDQARQARGTYVPHEGGPGYATTGTGA